MQARGQTCVLITLTFHRKQIFYRCSCHCSSSSLSICDQVEHLIGKFTVAVLNCDWQWTCTHTVCSSSGGVAMWLLVALPMGSYVHSYWCIRLLAYPVNHITVNTQINTNTLTSVSIFHRSSFIDQISFDCTCLDRPHFPPDICGQILHELLQFVAPCYLFSDIPLTLCPIQKTKTPLIAACLISAFLPITSNRTIKWHQINSNNNNYTTDLRRPRRCLLSNVPMFHSLMLC